MAALLLPLRDIQCPIGKGKSVPLPSAIVLTSLKWSKKDMTIVESVHQELPELRSLHASVAGAPLTQSAAPPLRASWHVMDMHALCGAFSANGRGSLHITALVHLAPILPGLT